MIRYLLIGLIGFAGLSPALASDPGVARGGAMFANWCAGCHTLRYSPTPFAEFKQVSMPETEALHWFGKMPPDLSLIITVKGKPWLIDYLEAFYKDSTRPFGTNNHVMPGVMMPNAFAATALHSPLVVNDLVDFLDYVADPNQLLRGWLGRKVLLFLGIFWLVLYALQRVIWKKIVRHI